MSLQERLRTTDLTNEKTCLELIESLLQRCRTDLRIHSGARAERLLPTIENLLYGEHNAHWSGDSLNELSALKIEFHTLSGKISLARRNNAQALKRLETAEIELILFSAQTDNREKRPSEKYDLQTESHFNHLKAMAATGKPRENKLKVYQKLQGKLSAIDNLRAWMFMNLGRFGYWLDNKFSRR